MRNEKKDFVILGYLNVIRNKRERKIFLKNEIDNCYSVIGKCSDRTKILRNEKEKERENNYRKYRYED